MRGLFRMSQVVIENPIINSPFDEPTRHFRFTDEGITNEEVDGRGIRSYLIPIAKPKKKGKQQLQFDTEWTQDRIEENKLVNDIRRRVAMWRKGPSSCTGRSLPARLLGLQDWISRQENDFVNSTAAL